jgi:hypothetical protein
MSEQTKDRHKNTVPLGLRVPSDLKVSVDQYQQSNGLETRNEAGIQLLKKGLSTSLQASVQALNPKCKNCTKHGRMTAEGKIRCITKKGASDRVQIQLFSMPDAWECAEKNFNTPTDRKTIEQFDTEITLLTTERDNAIGRHQRDYRKLEKMKATEEKLERAQSEIDFLNAQLKPVENLLEQKTALENDNEFKIERMKELEAIVETQSHDALIQKNQELMTRIDECEADLKSEYTSHKMESEQAKGEIEKLEALVKIQKDQKTDILFTMEKTLKDFKQFLPETSSTCKQCVSGFDWKEYRQNTLKVIQNLEGYLQTVAR